MTKLPITNMKGEHVGELELADNLLELKRGAQAVTEAVTAFRAGLRAGTASTKVKGDVAGTGAKPFKQKGTGRARAGMRRSPLWKGGGVTFGPHPRDFSKHVNKKAGRLAFRRAFSERVAAGEVTVIDEIRLAAPKTREMAALLKGCGAVAGALIVVDRIEDDIQRAARNIPTLSLETASDVNVYGLLRYPRVIVSKAAMAVIEKRLAAPVRRGA